MELKETEIVASYSGKIATGRFENAAPFFSIKETWTDVDEEFVQSRQKALHGMCYERFAECEKREIADRIKEQNRHFRFYQINNEQFPSVTSIIGWDADFFIPQEQLIQYGARGTIIHITATTGSRPLWEPWSPSGRLESPSFSVAARPGTRCGSCRRKWVSRALSFAKTEAPSSSPRGERIRW